jgi:hypothetical protein
LTALEDSLDLAAIKHHPWDQASHQAHNMMCSQTERDLALELRACRGPLAAAALKVLRTLNEGNGAAVVGSAAAFLAHLLEPWLVSTSEATTLSQSSHHHAAILRKPDIPPLVFPTQAELDAHHAAKRDIAVSLRAQGILDAVFAQLRFWADEWGGSCGDCGRPVLMALYQLLVQFPEEVLPLLEANPGVVGMVRHRAANKRSQDAQSAGGLFRLARQVHYECDGSRSIQMERLIDGRSGADPAAHEGNPASLSVPAAS